MAIPVGADTCRQNPTDSLHEATMAAVIDTAPPEQAMKSPEVNRLTGLVVTTEEWYKRNRLEEDVQNLSYYRGKFWVGDGVGTFSPETARYTAQQNEIFPIVDSIVSALAMDVPAVECRDQRARPQAPSPDVIDTSESGKRIAATLNFWAEEDELDTLIQEWTLHALLFRFGVVKCQWSPTLGRAIWRNRLPWEIHFDPGAKRIADVTWSFERFVLHIDDLESRVASGAYFWPQKPIKADTYPRSLIDDRMTVDQEAELRSKGLREYVSLVEFWDYRKQKIYHIHVETNQVLLVADAPYPRPYEVLVFHSGVGRIGGIADVSLLTSLQRDINEMVSARREIVRRLPRRMLMDRKMWQSDTDFERFKNSKTYEPSLVEVPTGMNIGDGVWVSPEMPTTFDFNNHLSQTTDSIHFVSGLGDFQRGEVKNIRTAAEAGMVRSAVEGRLNIRSKKLVRGVTNLFKKGLDVWRWAVANPGPSAIDMDTIAYLTQAQADGEQLAQDVTHSTPQFRVLPFSPLMEDKYVRRGQLVNLIQYLGGAGPLASAINQQALAREIVADFGFDPSLVKTDEQIAAETQAAQAAAAPPAGMPGMDTGSIPVGDTLAQQFPTEEVPL
jgi:hypothetical protein